MKSDFEQIKLDVLFLKILFLNNNSKEIIYLEKTISKIFPFSSYYSIVLAEFDESYKLTDKINIFYLSTDYIKNNGIEDYAIVNGDQICILYSESYETFQRLLITSIRNYIFYEIPLNKKLSFSSVEFFKERNLLIIIGNNKLYCRKYIESSQKYQFVSKIEFGTEFKLKILNKNTIILSTDEGLLILDANSFRIKRKIFYDDVDEEAIKEDEDDDEIDVGNEGNYEYREEITYYYKEETQIKMCLSNDKKFLAVSNSSGRLLIYDTRNYRKEKIKNYENYNIPSIPFGLNFEEEMKKINTILISGIYAVKNYFVLTIRYAIQFYENRKYKYDLALLEKEGNIWKFKNCLDLSIDEYKIFQSIKDNLYDY